MREKKHCETCGASIMEHQHKLSTALVEGLRRLHRVAGIHPVNIKTLGLTRNQWDNFQKLRYWGLTKRSCDEHGVRKRGHWEVTLQGVAFLDGVAALPPKVWTYRGEAKRFEGTPLRIGEVLEGYRKHDDYAADAQAHGEASL